VRATADVFICIVAGTAEEVVYCGVMTELAQRLIGVAMVTIVAFRSVSQPSTPCRDCEA